MRSTRETIQIAGELVRSVSWVLGSLGAVLSVQGLESLRGSFPHACIGIVLGFVLVTLSFWATQTSSLLTRCVISLCWLLAWVGLLGVFLELFLRATRGMS